MAVRITQPPIDLRSKLSELERPIGLKGSELLRAETTQEARELVSAGRKNIIINGDMKIHQRGGTITATNSNSSIYGLDRWRTWCYPSGVSAVFTLQQATSNPPLGFHNYLRWTTTTAYAVSGNIHSFFDIQQSIEGHNLKGTDIGKSTAKPLTISFWVRSSIAGKYTFTTNYVGSNPSSYLKYYNIDSVNTWEYKTITLPPQTATASGESAGSGGGIILSWNMGMGSTYGSTSTTEGYIHNKYELGGSVRIIENTNATFDITGVQLEVGKNATEFDHRSYGEELALCQRYYWELGSYDTNNWAPIAIFLGQTSTRAFGSIPTPVTMRAHPNITFNSVNIYNGGSDIALTNLFRYSKTGRNEEYDGLSWEANTASGLSAGTTYRINIKNTSGTSGYIRLDAEL